MRGIFKLEAKDEVFLKWVGKSWWSDDGHSAARHCVPAASMRQFMRFVPVCGETARGIVAHPRARAFAAHRPPHSTQISPTLP